MFPFWVDVSSGLWLPWLSAALIAFTCLVQVFVGVN